MTRDYFNLLECQMEGSNLIEASAGTGKTYSIAMLYLKALLEEKVDSVKNILVLTFTKAATSEIKIRIYSNLLKARKIIQDSDNLHNTQAPEDTTLFELLTPYLQDKTNTLKKLSKAIRNFDESAVYTIHGFCNFVLNEYAFSSGSLFAKKIITDQSTLVQDCIMDYWRKYAFYAPKCALMGLEKLSIDDLYNIYQIKENNPHASLSTNTAQDFADSAKLEEKYNELEDIFLKTKASLRDMTADALIALLPLNNLDKRKYPEKKLLKSAELLLNFFQTDSPLYTKEIDLSDMELFTAEKINSAYKKNCEQSELHELFNHLQLFAEAYAHFIEIRDAWIISFESKMIDFVYERLSRYKEERGLMYFSDQLLHLYNAVKNGSEDFREKIGQYYQLVFVDEFQDTDPLQYEIINDLFVGRSAVFFIGDPKQSIYSFRGADIYAYLKAKDNVDNTFTMTTNFRSAPSLVESVNYIFTSNFRASMPFAIDRIAYSKTDAACSDEDNFFIENISEKPFKIWVLDSNDNKPLKTEEYLEIVASKTASEIARILKLAKQGKAFITENGRKRPVKPADFAVLCRKSKEVLEIKKFLDYQNIPAIISVSESIFESEEAYETALILTALAEPSNINIIKNLLITELFGYDLTYLRDKEDSEKFVNFSIRFRHYREIFETKGIMACLNHILEKEGLIESIIKTERGQRKITNVNQLAEILHKKESESSMSLYELTNWLNGQRVGNMLKEEEYDLRMETDEKAVNLLTIHKSKGLQFPIVFAPFLLSASVNNKFRPFVFHDENHCSKFQITKDNETERLHATETLSENLRLSYVALTRAKYLCYTVWARTTNVHTSSLGYLFSNHDFFSKETKNYFDTVENLKEPLGKALDPEAFSHIDIIDIDADIDYNYRWQPEIIKEETSEEKLIYTPPGIKTLTHWEISSFSTLAKHVAQPASPEAIYEDEIFLSRETNIDKQLTYTMAELPKGANTGNAMHEILEKLDLSVCSSEESEKLINQMLQKYSIDIKFNQTILENINNLKNKILDKDANLRLKNIPPSDTLHEMEFYFPAHNINLHDISSVFKQQAGGSKLESKIAESLKADPDIQSTGFMKGYIDFIFRHKNKYYIIDWKTNYLGSTTNDYSYDFMVDAICDSLYFLQYHIYIVALILHLRQHIPDLSYDKHFGGVYYIFLRGLNDNEYDQNGIFYHKPSEQTIANLMQCFKIAPIKKP